MVANNRAWSMNTSISQEYEALTHGRSEPKTGALTSRSKSIATGPSVKSGVGSRLSISGQRLGGDQLWYEVGTPKSSPRNKYLSDVEKHKEAFQSSLAQGSGAIRTDGEIDITFKVKAPMANEVEFGEEMI